MAGNGAGASVIGPPRARSPARWHGRAPGSAGTWRGGQVRRRQANLRGPPIAVRPRRVDGPLPRAANGTLLPGSQLVNAGGRPRGALDEFRAKFNPRMPEIAEVLLGLLRSQNESTRLSAHFPIHEAGRFDMSRRGAPGGQRGGRPSAASRGPGPSLDCQARVPVERSQHHTYPPPRPRTNTARPPPQRS